MSIFRQHIASLAIVALLVVTGSGIPANGQGTGFDIVSLPDEALPPVVTPHDSIAPSKAAGEVASQPGNETQADSAAETPAKSDDKSEEEQKKKEEEEKKKKDAAKKKKEKQEKLKKSAAGAYKPLFYDNDFSYLNDSAYCGWHLLDAFKEINFGCCNDGCCTSCTGCGCAGNLSLDIGGQYRFRFHGERNHRGLGLTGVDDEFLLHRTRLFANLRLGDRLRFFGEYLDAVSFHEDFAPRPIEENRSDMLNLFVDAVLVDTGNATLSGRVGRQELLYGVQRIISPLDWANTRRTFDGYKMMWQRDKLQVDGFWMRPLRVHARQFDNPNLDQSFYGIYSTYSGKDKDKFETYWLAFDNDVTGFKVDSMGGRYLEGFENWLFELWGNYQFGDNADGSSHNSGAWTVGFGHKWDSPWKPTLWAYYDWASGDDALGAGNGYFHFFPLAHKYLGFMDFFGRRNIESPNVQFTLQPNDKLKLLCWYYYFFLQDKRDTPYSVVMTPFNPGIAPGSADLGHELDCLATYKLSDRSNLVLGYSHFFAGKYYETPGIPFNGDADFFYVQYHMNF